eukprot:TRINITY_DN16979_c0_g1_i1.p1 TRINITY_DN16979_c0_g1~~TRINITY_DN16979_c0_g1_i1.p1  ORF type:complete len:762 (-),score=161.32 TRINITY_DN16979_c0_g1_i1:424-2709(-)
MAVMLETSLGEMVVDLFTGKCPITTKNFLKLCKIKYYNNCLFHDVQKDFIVQSGDPTGTGKGGDSIYKFLYGDQARFFDDEIDPRARHDRVGLLAMASSEKNQNASQFYITTRAEVDSLDGKHTIFGEVAEGLETLTRINEAYVDEKGRPYKNIRIKHTYILDDPFDDPPGLEALIPPESPKLRPLQPGEEIRLEDDWEPADQSKDAEEFENEMKQKEAQTRAVVLEMIGDLPDADVKPPENVLFVCRLNPVTQDEDLEIIFARFGKVNKADVIRDFKSGESLCYAFIEFDTRESCEAAYFKMENVLIDDRRIHVDFSQSVGQLWNRFRRIGSKDSAAQGAGNFGGKDTGGCFKCGRKGHFARECPGQDAAQGEGEEQNKAVPQRPKFELKKGIEGTGGMAAVRGAASNDRYGLVFDTEDEPRAHKDSTMAPPRDRSRMGPSSTDGRTNGRKRRWDSDGGNGGEQRQQNGAFSRREEPREMKRFDVERGTSENEKGRERMSGRREARQGRNDLDCGDAWMEKRRVAGNGEHERDIAGSENLLRGRESGDDERFHSSRNARREELVERKQERPEKERGSSRSHELGKGNGGWRSMRMNTDADVQNSGRERTDRHDNSEHFPHWGRKDADEGDDHGRKERGWVEDDHGRSQKGSGKLDDASRGRGTQASRRGDDEDSRERRRGERQQEERGRQRKEGNDGGDLRDKRPYGKSDERRRDSFRDEEKDHWEEREEPRSNGKQTERGRRESRSSVFRNKQRTATLF